MVFLKGSCSSRTSKCDLIWKDGFTVVINSGSQDKIILYLGWTLNLVTFALRRRGHIESQRGRCHVKQEAKIGVMQLQAKECHKLLATSGSEERGTKQLLSWCFEKKINPANTLISDFWSPEFLEL